MQPVTTRRAPGRFDVGQREDGVDRLLAGRLDERAGVDHDEVGVLGAVGGLSPSASSEATTLSESTAFFGQPSVSTKNRGATDRILPGPLHRLLQVIAGLVEPGFEGVADALRANFERRGDVGAACCLYLDGRPVVDIWGGIADVPSGRRWREDTLVLVFSTTKGATAVCANLLVQRGILDPDQPVRGALARVRGERQGGHPARAVLSHRAGLPVVEGDFTLETALAWDPVVEQLARQRPRWDWHEPTPGYHVRSYGWITGEVVRRVDRAHDRPVLRRGGGRTARARLVDRAARGARSRAWRRCWLRPRTRTPRCRS